MVVSGSFFRNKSYSKRRLALSESVSVILVTRSPRCVSRRLWRFAGAGGETRTLFHSAVIRMVSETHTVSVLALV